MSETTDDMQAWSDAYCDNYDEIDVEYFLEKIANAELSDFNNQHHMINYMKKMARLALENLYE